LSYNKTLILFDICYIPSGGGEQPAFTGVPSQTAAIGQVRYPADYWGPQTHTGQATELEHEVWTHLVRSRI